MEEPSMDPVRPDDVAVPASPAPKQVCIISGDPLRPRAFMAALDPALRANEELTIIVDRRRGGSGTAADRPRIERRRHPAVDAKVKADGFAIVPLSSEDPPWIERFSDRQSPDDDADGGERAIQRILEFKRQRRVRVGPLLGVSAVVGAFIVLVVIFVQMPGGLTIVSRPRPAAVPSAERSAAPAIPAQAPAVKTPAPIETSASSPRPSPPPSRAERVSRPRDATRPPTDAVSPPPGPQPSASPQSERGSSNPEPVAVSRGEATSELSEVQPTSAPDATPPPRPRAITPSQPAGPAVTAPEPPRSHEPSSSTPRPRTAATPGDSPARPSSAPTQPTFKSSMKDLETVVTRDMTAAGVEAQRQFGEVKSKTMEKLDELRRAWNRSFTDRPSDEAAAARARR